MRSVVEMTVVPRGVHTLDPELVPSVSWVKYPTSSTILHTQHYLPLLKDDTVHV